MSWALPRRANNHPSLSSRCGAQILARQHRVRKRLREERAKGRCREQAAEVPWGPAVDAGEHAKACSTATAVAPAPLARHEDTRRIRKDAGHGCLTPNGRQASCPHRASYCAFHSRRSAAANRTTSLGCLSAEHLDASSCSATRSMRLST